MPRRRKPENENNPLLLLRNILTEAETPTRITQDLLANVIQYPLGQIKNVEAGRRPLSARLQESIARWTGAFWDHKRRGWMFGPDKKVPYTGEIYRRYREVVRGPLQYRGIDLKVLHRKVDALFEEAPQRNHYALLMQLSVLLEKCRTEFELKGLAQFFEETEPAFDVIYSSETGELLRVYQNTTSVWRYIRSTKKPGDQSATVDDVIIDTSPEPLPPELTPEELERRIQAARERALAHPGPSPPTKEAREWAATQKQAQLAREKGTTTEERSRGRKAQKARATSGRTARL